ncbi:phytanoyl-CoA dioxygenase family protein [bacterium]|nr:phytanoyl-CoA dioxygenase family protein [bacterium]
MPDTFLDRVDLSSAREALKSRGYYLIENAYDSASCQQVRQFIDEHESDPKVEVNYAGSEIRLWGSQDKSPSLSEFYTTSKTLLERLSGQAPQPHTLLAIRNRPIDEASQTVQLGRWHLDSFFNQMKVFLFLTDTTEASGPFECIPGSHRWGFKLRMLAKGLYVRPADILGGKRTYQSLEESWIDSLSSHGYRPQPVLCKAGTVMVVNTSAIHRARPCLKGNRYALTAYFH